ncbi:hypothetical protein [Terrisporobacter petrolearius]|uniref:hypothetical protein n=1 Tax=Terrisporobacter petrolearius TaxID=1460447 RepID=UPI0022DF4460|nr:hypothetical protein [Terrisporobacter petrolearius]
MKSKFYKNKMKDLIKETHEKDFEDTILIIVKDYYYRSEDDRILLEKALKGFIIDIDKISLFSLIIFTIPPIANALFGNYIDTTIFFYAILYVGLGWVICSFAQKYKFYNLYIDTINNLREKKIVILKKIVKDIELKEEIELKYDSKVK